MQRIAENCRGESGPCTIETVDIGPLPILIFSDPR